jgi:toxoflavin synthase
LLSFSAQLGETLWSPDISVHWWSWSALEAALQAAGLTNVRRTRPTVSKTGVEKYGEAHWKHYLDVPHAILIEADKPGHAA